MRATVTTDAAPTTGSNLCLVATDLGAATREGSVPATALRAKGRQCLPPPTAPKRPNRLVLGPAAGQEEEA
uniref:Uncharacterized protein n=1 Tax=Leersia perrieri TaxID=77586 RepID=A0A0D9XXB1_9ORYZ